MGKLSFTGYMRTLYRVSLGKNTVGRGRRDLVQDSAVVSGIGCREDFCTVIFLKGPLGVGGPGGVLSAEGRRERGGEKKQTSWHGL